MRELVIDLTPTCINRTAIYHIAMETYAALDHAFDVTPQYRGASVPRPANRAAETTVADAFFSDIRSWADQSVHLDEIDPWPRVSADRATRLYFDPIYTLYRPLQAWDVVFVLDTSPLTNPEWHRPAVTVAYERAFRRLAGSPAKIVCISDHCAASLRASFAIPQSDIVTVPLYLRRLPSRQRIAKPRCLPADRYFLFVGSLETRKNLIGLMRAFALAGLASRGWTLKIAGGDGEGHAAIREAAAELTGIEILGFVTDEELAELYADAGAFAYPSYLEGFGLPLLEAMARGLPCLASVTGASHEVCGDLAILVDPYHVPSIVDGLVRCAHRSELRDAAARRRLVQRAETFTFQRYLDALRTVLESTGE